MKLLWSGFGVEPGRWNHPLNGFTAPVLSKMRTLFPSEDNFEFLVDISSKVWC